MRSRSAPTGKGVWHYDEVDGLIWVVGGAFFAGLGVSMLTIKEFGARLIYIGTPRFLRTASLRVYGLDVEQLRRLIGIGYIRGGTAFIGLGVAAVVG